MRALRAFASAVLAAGLSAACAGLVGVDFDNKVLCDDACPAYQACNGGDTCEGCTASDAAAAVSACTQEQAGYVPYDCPATVNHETIAGCLELNDSVSPYVCCPPPDQ